MSLQKNRKIPISSLVLTVALLASLIFGGMYFKKYSDLKKQSSKTAEQINEELIAKVGKVYQLPSDETPVILNVNKDPSEFTTDQEKSFAKTFKDLKKDDIILLYEKASLAVEYRPSDNKVISTATLTINNVTDVGIIASTDAQTTMSNLLATKLGTEVRVGNKSTPVGQYSTTIVVDISGKKADIAQKVADAVGGSVAENLPSDEIVPDGAEIVVLVANKSAN
ncbi:hypothetical protein KC930_03065 [Candidatus Saccharibacteria bacterium]|nr:hypothetical protein [Candidatus Saccharibacteria bacterium]